MPFSRLYTASRVAVILSGGCEQILIIISASEANFPPELVVVVVVVIVVVGLGGGRGDRRSVRPFVRSDGSFIGSSVRVHDRCTFVRSFDRACPFI